MDHKPMLARIDVRSTAPGHDEMQPVRGDRAVQQMVRRTSPLGSRQPLRIHQGAYYAFLEPRWLFVGPDGSAGFESPRRIGQRRVRRLRVLHVLGSGAD